jgi:hypothetical protein
MDLNHMLLAVGCAASLPSAGIMLRSDLDRRLTIEMAIGVAICITCLGLVLSRTPISFLLVLAVAAVTSCTLVKRQQMRWPLLMLAAFAFLAYLHRTGYALT